MDDLHKLAEAAGIERSWRDVGGADNTVADDVLAAILGALGHPAGSVAEIARSLAQIEEDRRQPPALLVTETGIATSLPFAAARAELIAEDGRVTPVCVDDGMLQPISIPGYYRLFAGGHEQAIAVAPPACPSPAAFGSGRLWGPAIQIPSLRRAAPTPFGTFGDLAQAVEAFARHGADMVAISPAHALFPGTGEDFSPYSPSSRLFLNGALADPVLAGLPPLPPREGGPLIDWHAALPQRLADLRALHAALDPALRAGIDADCAAQGEALHRHALFDAIDCRMRPGGAKGWQDWPAALRDPASKAVRTFAAEHADEVAFHTFVQWLAERSLGAVQARARASGMAVGLLGDLAVGVRPGGSDGWAMRNTMLDGLTIGAPPDPLGPHGQDWGLTTFSPLGLARTGYAPWIALLRASFAHAGALRIDHAFGLSRLWVIPQGGAPGDGAYLRYPFLDLVRLVALEAHRANALVIGEDLGTAPPGFAEAMRERAMLGMRVLWFERAADHGFIGAHDHAPLSVAMTGTHDTPTVAGWWTGRDLDWAERMHRLPKGIDRAKAGDIREWDRGLLWSTIGGPGPHPAPADPAPAVEAALAHIAKSSARLAIAPLEDVLALQEQANLPGTTSVHPNWRRRLEAPLERLLEQPGNARRVASLMRG